MLYHAATIRGRLDFEGIVYGDRYAHAYTASIISLFVCTYNARVHADIVVDPVPCGEISRVAFIGMCWLKYAAIFRGRQDFEVRRDLEEIRYINFEASELSVVIWKGFLIYQVQEHIT